MERGKASLGEARLLRSALMQTGLPMLRGKSPLLPSLPIQRYRMLPVRPMYPCRYSRELELISEVGRLEFGSQSLEGTLCYFLQLAKEGGAHQRSWRGDRDGLGCRA